MPTPPRDLYGARVVRFAGDPTWPEAPDDVVPDTSFEGSVVALAIAKSDDQQGYFTFWLYEDGTVAVGVRLFVRVDFGAQAIQMADRPVQFPLRRRRFHGRAA